MRLPTTTIHIGDEVTVYPSESEIHPFKATVIGIRIPFTYGHKSPLDIEFTLLEDGKYETDGYTEEDFTPKDFHLEVWKH